ncbi:MAG TPA: winged helix-turn-helix domain-containing protein [Anaerolineales bacterium]|nr:winged helix-turn-helix domain-containing protein [Anaerolineales bacterium]HNA89738.1 winged helix-turn-helix domain-containing protein [Anaerolineales bacterium]HNB37251.1 winged helix-turn-helix domain-containing protein [Anaerolineales bacterium]HNC08919.1 winged helix-turn-helix domain-containing protein [Anaerolineales bacterium]
MKKDQTKKRFHVSDLETLRAISDPLRVQILELLERQVLTVKQVGEKLGLASSKLYYHFGALEKLGLIEVAETRMVANMLEKTYRSAAELIDVDPSLFKFSKDGDNEPINIILSTTIDATREDLLRSLQARQFQLNEGSEEQPRRMIINRVVNRIPEKRLAEFQDRLAKLVQEFDEVEPSSKSDDQPYALTVAFYPSFYFDKQSKKRKSK